MRLFLLVQLFFAVVLGCFQTADAACTNQVCLFCDFGETTAPNHLYLGYLYDENSTSCDDFDLVFWEAANPLFPGYCDSETNTCENCNPLGDNDDKSLKTKNAKKTKDEPKGRSPSNIYKYKLDGTDAAALLKIIDDYHHDHPIPDVSFLTTISGVFEVPDKDPTKPPHYIVVFHRRVEIAANGGRKVIRDCKIGFELKSTLGALKFSGSIDPVIEKKSGAKVPNLLAFDLGGGVIAYVEVSTAGDYNVR
ncbi:hypothetical protein [Planctomicrobium piriforme]|nr:hypothetical protein [Planctomicrobium piriforme]